MLRGALRWRGAAFIGCWTIGPLDDAIRINDGERETKHGHDQTMRLRDTRRPERSDGPTNNRCDSRIGAGD